MPDLLSIESISELGWGVELFAVVMLTFIGRYLGNARAESTRRTI